MPVDTLTDVTSTGRTRQVDQPEFFAGPESSSTGVTVSGVVTWVGATPSAIELGSLHHPQLRLRRRLPLQIEHDEGFVAVWNPELEEFGYGSYLTAAIEDFQRVVAELYSSLKDNQEHLGPDMLRLWHLLEDIVEERA